MAHGPFPAIFEARARSFEKRGAMDADVVVVD
jgi:hypothetical protein